MTLQTVDLDRDTKTLLDAAAFYRARGTAWDIVAERLELLPAELNELLRQHKLRYEHYASWHQKDMEMERHHAELARLRRELRDADSIAKKLDAAARLQAEVMRREAASVRKELDSVRKQIAVARAAERAARKGIAQRQPARGAPLRPTPRENIAQRSGSKILPRMNRDIALLK